MDNSSVKNATQLAGKLQDVTVEDDEIIVSFDIKS